MVKVSLRDNRMWQVAMKVAEMSDCRQRHGAVIVKSGRVLSVACNKNCGHPFTAAHRMKTTHAEQRAIAIRAKSGNTTGSTLYSARTTGKQDSKPCKVCRQLMKDAGIKWVVYFNGRIIVKERV